MAPRLTCDFCYHECSLAQGQAGSCGVRVHQGDSIRTIGYARPVSIAVDPMEKKPMYHFLPGHNTLSIALFGCNYTCTFCQNHSISQKESALFNSIINRRQEEVRCREVVKMLISSGAPVMSYTYSEPIVWQDYMLDIARLVKEHGLLNCMVTNGSFSKSSLERILPLIDAFNIDVKGDEEFYHTYCGGRLQPVLDAVTNIASRDDKVLEVTTMVIEGVHTLDMIETLGRQLHDAGVKVWHLSRFFPHWKMRDINETSERFLEKALECAFRSDIEFIYGGNTMSNTWQATKCPGCDTILVTGRRYGTGASHFTAESITDGHCGNCHTSIYGKFGLP